MHRVIWAHFSAIWGVITDEKYVYWYLPHFTALDLVSRDYGTCVAQSSASPYYLEKLYIVVALAGKVRQSC